MTGKIDVAITRNDHTFRSGHGQIADIVVVMIDDISGKTTITDTLVFEVSDVRMIRLDGSEIPVNPQSTSLIVSDDPTSLDEDILSSACTLFPNPANDRLFIRHELQEQLDIRIYDLNGKLLVGMEQAKQEEELDISTLASGMYLVELRTATARLVRKLQKQ